MPDPKHCDDYADDPTQPECLRVYINHARSPAHGSLNPKPWPKLFATYRGVEWRGISDGDRVRVTVCSRMGDVGITKDLDADAGYEARVFLEKLSDFGVEP